MAAVGDPRLATASCMIGGISTWLDWFAAAKSVTAFGALARLGVIQKVSALSSSLSSSSSSPDDSSSVLPKMPEPGLAAGGSHRDLSD